VGGHVALTEAGRTLAERQVRRHRVVKAGETTLALDASIAAGIYVKPA